MKASKRKVAAVAKRPSAARPDLDWRPFERGLAEVLSRLRPGQCIFLEKPGSDLYLQFGRGVGSFVAEAVSNQFLKRRDRLSGEAVALMLELGWTAPNGDDENRPNFRVAHGAMAPWTKVARLAVRSLREAYGVEEPGQLTWRSMALAEGKPKPVLPGWCKQA
jgi:hypothetical protein